MEDMDLPIKKQNKMTYQDSYEKSLSQKEDFWKNKAKAIDWFKFPSSILSKDEHDLYRWYKDGKLNTCYLALDYHVNNGRGEQLALIYDSPVTNKKATYTYQKLLEAVAKFAGVLKSKGVEKGDRVIIYMPMIPESVIAISIELFLICQLSMKH